jgi:hypothetical protein
MDVTASEETKRRHKGPGERAPEKSKRPEGRDGITTDDMALTEEPMLSRKDGMVSNRTIGRRTG